MTAWQIRHILLSFKGQKNNRCQILFKEQKKQEYTDFTHHWVLKQSFILVSVIITFLKKYSI